MRNPLVYHSLRFLGSFLLKRVMPYFSVGIVLSHSTNTFRERTLLCCFKNLPVAKRFMDKGQGGSIKIYRRIFFVSQCRQNRSRTILCSTKLLVSAISMDKTGKLVQGLSRFSVTNCCLRVSKIIVEEPSCASKYLRYRKTLRIREGAGFTIFRQKCFVSRYRSF